ncbi:MAG: hypothetical protein LAN61_07525 [Acidobacteriia bacterium]|nr:hypothetical protein [Terriglobia bacterium]
MSNEIPEMSCQEFAELGLDAERDAAQMSAMQRAVWEAHRRACARCAAQSESLGVLRGQLRTLAEETRTAQAPPRIEMQLRRHVQLLGFKRRGERRKTAVAAAILAAAAVLVAAVGVRHWMRPAEPVVAINPPVPPNAPENSATQNTAPAAQAQDDFTLLPDGLPVATEDDSIVSVRMPRAALAALGLPVNEEQSGEPVLVDLLVSADGQPQAVRLSR